MIQALIKKNSFSIKNWKDKSLNFIFLNTCSVFISILRNALTINILLSKILIINYKTTIKIIEK